MTNTPDDYSEPWYDPEYDPDETSHDVTPEAEAWHDALMFGRVFELAARAAIPAPYGAATGYRYSEWPQTAAFFAEHVAASAVRPEPDELWCRCGIGPAHKRGHGITS